MADLTNPAPDGNGTGAAVVFGDSLGGLRMLRSIDAMNQRRAALAAAAAQKAKEADERDFASRLKLSPEAGVSYVPLLKNSANNTYKQMEAIATNGKLSRYERAIQQTQLQDEHNRLAAASVKVDQHVVDTGQRVTTDKRYDKAKTISLLHDSLYKKNEDGTPMVSPDGKPQMISPLEYEPQHTEDAVLTGNTHMNGVEVYKSFLRGNHPDAITYKREAKPGGRGYEDKAESDTYELKDGKIQYDPKTNLPIVKATPQALNYFLSDPVNRQYLDGFEQAHQKQFATAVEKMKNLQQLTPEESAAVRLENAPAGRQMELFKQGLLEQGYGRQSHSDLFKPAPRPPRTAAAKAPKFTQDGGTEFTPGVIGATGMHGTAGMAHFGMGTPLTRTLANGDVKDYTANAIHRNYLVAHGDGQAVERVTNNTSPQSLAYKAPVVLLRKPSGTVIFPHDKHILDAANQGDSKPLEEWARAERAKDPSLKHAYYMSAVPDKTADLQVGSEEELYQQLKDGSALQAKAAAGSTLTAEEKHKNEMLAATMAAVNQGKAPTGKAPLTDGQLRAAARKLYGDQNATLYVPYEGEEKLKIDAATGYTLRQPKQKQAMADYLAGVESRTRPRADTPRPATSTGGYYAPKPSAAPRAPAALPAKPAAKSATAGLY